MRSVCERIRTNSSCISTCKRRPGRFAESARTAGRFLFLAGARSQNLGSRRIWIERSRPGGEPLLSAIRSNRAAARQIVVLPDVLRQAAPGNVSTRGSFYRPQIYVARNGRDGQTLRWVIPGVYNDGAKSGSLPDLGPGHIPNRYSPRS
jgi:hypothetical protein